VLNIQFRGRPSKLQKDCIAKNISVSLRVIYLPEKKGSYLAVFEIVEGKLL
jgi:hypothetical protein